MHIHKNVIFCIDSNISTKDVENKNEQFKLVILHKLALPTKMKKKSPKFRIIETQYNSSSSDNKFIHKL